MIRYNQTVEGGETINRRFNEKKLSHCLELILIHIDEYVKKNPLNAKDEDQIPWRWTLSTSKEIYNSPVVSALEASTLDMQVVIAFFSVFMRMDQPSIGNRNVKKLREQGMDLPTTIVWNSWAFQATPIYKVNSENYHKVYEEWMDIVDLWKKVGI